MDDGLDDLFRDAPTLQLPDPIPRGLIQRLDELSLSGCCQKLTWSKPGCIAYVSQDGRNVVLRHLLCDPYDGHWRMSKEYPIDDVPIVHGENQIVHLSWSHSGNELAVIDAFGRLSIYNVLLAINRVNTVRRCTLDPEDDMSAVVGMMWLYSDRWGFFHQPMHKSATEGWVFKCSQRKLLGPRNLMQRPALMVVTRTGSIRVLALGQDNRWQDFKTEIESIGSPSEILTHAAICPEKIADKSSVEQDSALLVATYNSDKELRIYLIKIDFERSTVDLHRAKLHSRFCPPDINPDNSTNVGASRGHTQLSSLEIIPPGPKPGTRELTPPFVLASFSHIPVEFAAVSTQDSQWMILCKLELQLLKPKLHSSFEGLSTKRATSASSIDLPAEYVLKSSPDLILSKTLLGVHQINMSTILLLMYSDGSIEYRDRNSMNVVSQDARDGFTFLGQVGFDNILKKPCLHTSVSPNFCAVITLDEMHVATLSLMQIGNQEILDDSLLEAADEAFVMQGSLAAMISPSYNDDLLAAMQAFFDQHLYIHAMNGPPPGLGDRDVFKRQYLNDMYRVLGLQYDYSVESHPQRIIQDTVYQKCLSTQASLGYLGANGRPSLSSIVAQTALDLRYVAYTNLLASRSKPGSESELKNPDSVHFLIGLVSWLMALFSFIMDEIFTLSNFIEEKGEITSSNLDALNQKVQDMNSPALPLLMISSSRTLLRINCINMRSLMSSIKTHSGSNPLGFAYRELEAIFQKSPVTVLQFERLILEIDANIRNTYQHLDLAFEDNGQPRRLEEARNSIEKDMLIQGIIPDIHLDPIRKLFSTTVNSLKAEVNVAELYFTNIGWLGLTDDRTSKKWREKHPIDTMRKTVIKTNTRTKRCTRCGGLTEDLLPFRGVNMLMMSTLRNCLCGNWFMVGEEDSVAQLEHNGF